MRSSQLDERYDDALGWWLYREGDRYPYPYRASTRGIFFGAPNDVVGIDLRKAKAPLDARVTRPLSLIADRTAAETLLPRRVDSRCPDCGSTALALHEDVQLPDDQLVCSGCGAMFELGAYVELAGYPTALNWSLRLEGRWSAGDEELVAARPPTRVSAPRSAQAARMALTMARSWPLRAFAPGLLDDAGLQTLGDQPRLENLELWYTKITDAGLASLEGCTALRRLNAGNNRAISDEGARQIAKLSALEVLNLEQTAIGDSGLAELAKLKKLQVLILNATLVTDEGLRALRDHPSLRTIALSSTKVTEAGLAHLATIPTLEP